jgi:hypothetical protein
MGVSVGVNALSVKSGHQGVAVREFPDVCKAPSPGGPVPIPYPNLLGPGHQQTAGSKAAAGKTLATGGSFSSIRGNEPGTLKGVASMSTADKMARTQFLRNQMHSLHGQLWGLPGGNPNQWHKLVDQYVIATAELYKTLSE